MVDLKQAYVDACTQQDVRVNSGVKEKLPEGPDLEVLDLSSTLVGANGVKPVLAVVRVAPSLTTLVLKSQRLSSEAAQEVAESLKVHPTVTSIDLSGNHIPLAGPALLELVKANKKVVNLNIEETAVRPMFVNLITMQLEKNRGGAGSLSGPSGGNAPAEGGPSPSVDKRVRMSTEATVVVQDSQDADPFAKPFSGGGEEQNEGGFGGVSFVPAEGGRAGDLLRPGSAQDRVKRRPTVCSEVFGKNELDEFKAPVFAKSAEATKWLCERLEYVHLFSHLDDRELSTAVGAMEEVKYTMGQTIKEQGAEGDDKYYIIFLGEAEQVVDGTSQGLKKGDFFGELQLLYAETEQSTVKVSSTELVAYTIERHVYRVICAKASKQKRQQYGGFLEKIEFLKGMGQAQVNQLADALKSVRSKDGDCIIRYGEEGLWFHIIVEGVVEVMGRDKETGKEIKVCEFKAGDCVGELEFINNHKCVADVRAVGEVRSAKMNRKHFEMCMGPVKDLLKDRAAHDSKFKYYQGTQDGSPASKDEEVAPDGGFAEAAEEDGGFGAFGGFGGEGKADGDEEKRGSGGMLQVQRPVATRRRMTVSAEVISDKEAQEFKPDVVPKDDKTRDFIMTSLERMGLFCHLEDFEISQLAMAMKPHHHKKDDIIVKLGEDGDDFHLVTHGEVHGEGEEGDEPVEVRPGQYFGEVVLMYSQAYAMTYKATMHDVTTYSLDRFTYKNIMQRASMKKRAMYHDFLKEVNFLKTLSAAELLQLADALKPSQYKSGENLITYGDDGLWFYIIVEGTVEVIGRDKEGAEKKVCEFTVGHCVGELEFIHNHKCVADVKAQGNVRAAKMHRYHFELCMGPIVELLKKQAGESEVYEYYRETQAGQNAPVEASEYQKPESKS